MHFWGTFLPEFVCQGMAASSDTLHISPTPCYQQYAITTHTHMTNVQHYAFLKPSLVFGSAYHNINIIKDKDSEHEERHKAEEHVRTCCQENGELIIHGDQLTIENIESAKRAMKGSLTILGRLDLVSCTATGMFHCDMNFVIYSYIAQWVLHLGWGEMKGNKLMHMVTQTGQTIYMRQTRQMKHYFFCITAWNICFTSSWYFFFLNHSCPICLCLTKS